MRRSRYISRLPFCDKARAAYDFAAHVGRYFNVEQLKSGRSDILQIKSLGPQRRVAFAISQNEYSVPVMIGVVGSGIVFEGVDAIGFGRPDAADAAPTQVAEVYEKIRGKAADFAIDISRPYREGLHGVALVIRQG